MGLCQLLHVLSLSESFLVFSCFFLSPYCTIGHRSDMMILVPLSSHLTISPMKNHSFERDLTAHDGWQLHLTNRSLGFRVLPLLEVRPCYGLRYIFPLLTDNCTGEDIHHLGSVTSTWHIFERRTLATRFRSFSLLPSPSLSQNTV